MKISALKSVFIFVLAFICVLCPIHSASAHGEHANASKETATTSEAGDSRNALKEFVLHAKTHWEVPVPREQSLDLWKQILHEVQEQGDWKSGSNYLILVDKQGRSIAHGYYESAPGHDISGVFQGSCRVLCVIRPNDYLQQFPCQVILDHIKRLFYSYQD